MDQSEHAVIYTSQEAPEVLKGEHRITKDAIRVIPVNQEQELHPCSRINFAMTFPVQHNVKVLEVGIIAPGDMRKFMGYYQNELEKDLPSKR